MNNTRVFRFLSIALLAAIALYFAAQGYFALTDPFTTTLVYQSSAEDTIDVSGWLVRDEEVLSGESGTVRHEVSEGERVGKGQTVATVYSGSDALDTVQQIESKELQLQQLQFALSSYLNPDATLKLDGSITESLLSIRRSLSGGDYDDAADQTAQLKAAILKRSHTYSSGEEIEADIATVQGELSALRSSLSGARTVTAEHSGTYSAACDGYESLLTPEFYGPCEGKNNYVKKILSNANGMSNFQRARNRILYSQNKYETYTMNEHTDRIKRIGNPRGAYKK